MHHADACCLILAITIAPLLPVDLDSPMEEACYEQIAIAREDLIDLVHCLILTEVVHVQQHCVWLQVCYVQDGAELVAGERAREATGCNDGMRRGGMPHLSSR